MHIDLSVKEYFEQLQLMKAQYGQEEDLYPWIYMLLWMVEREKRKLLSGYEGISIRDVHNAVSGYKGIKEENSCAKEFKKYMQERLPFPDFIMFDRTIEKGPCKCFGCVEIKKLGENYVSVEPIDFKLYEPIYVMRWKEEYLGKEEYKQIEIDKEMYYTLSHVPSFLIKEVIKSENEITINIGIPKKKEDNQLTGKEELKINLQLEALKEPPAKARKGENRVQSIKPPNSPKGAFDEFKEGKDIFEMMSHIKSYKKVLYTNGLQFCSITLLGENEYNVTEIANLKKHYAKYADGASNQDDEVAAILEWEKLIKGLMDFDWCGPISESKVRE